MLELLQDCTLKFNSCSFEVNQMLISFMCDLWLY